MTCGVIPAAGRGSRFGGICKGLLDIDGRMLIEYPLLCMKQVGVKEVIIVCRDEVIRGALGTNHFGMPLKYVYQTDFSGIAGAISLCEEHTKDEDLFIVLGDIIYLGQDLKKLFSITDRNAVFGVQKVTDNDLIKPSYGILPGMPPRLIEKPVNTQKLLPLLGLGIYYAKKKIYDYIRQTGTDSFSKQKEITHVLDHMFGESEADYIELDGPYYNINSEDDLLMLKGGKV